MPDTHPYALAKGHRLEEYEVVRLLGAGGFGITYLAFDHQLDGPVAIKEYFPAEVAVRADGWRVVAASPGASLIFAWGLDRFLREARSIHRFRHPNVVRVHRYVAAHGTAYIVMEYVAGESLQEIVNGRGHLSADEWRRWLDPLLDGLAHVHGHGYLHRDIKPANIVIRAADGEPVLIDFGAARVAARERTHTQVLTPGYAPIEQYSSEGVQGPPTDIYALAAVSYRVLGGKPLPSAPDRVLDDRYEPLAGRIPGAGRAWLAAIDQGLALRPADRPQSVTAWRMAFMQTGDDSRALDAPAAASDGATSSAPNVTATAKRRTRVSGRVRLAASGRVGVALWLVVGVALTVALFWLSAVRGPVPGDRSGGSLPAKTPAPMRETPAPMSTETAARLRAAAERGDTPALEQLRLGASHGDVNAQFTLAVMHDLGAGTPEDDTLAVRWYRRAASRGHAEAQYNVAVAYAFGEGVPDDDVTAAVWFRRAAEQGHAGAQRFLGGMYDEGVGVPEDAVLAHMWVSIASANGDERAREALERIEAGMVPAQIADATSLARICMASSYRDCGALR